MPSKEELQVIEGPLEGGGDWTDADDAECPKPATAKTQTPSVLCFSAQSVAEATECQGPEQVGLPSPR